MIPPTVHPMLVHFPIALLFTSFLLDAVAVWRRDRFFETAGLTLLWLTLVSVIFAIVAGLYAATHVLVTPAVRPLLQAHRRDGIITGVIVAVIVLLRMRAHRSWNNTRRLSGEGTNEALKPWYYAGGAYILGLIMISATGVIGGSMVYDHGLGVAAIPPTAVQSARPPASSAPTTRTPSSSTGAVAQGQQIYTATCARCHGPTPPFSHSLVSSMGAANMQSFIASRMPPGRPVSSTQAKALVQYFNSL